MRPTSSPRERWRRWLRPLTVVAGALLVATLTATTTWRPRPPRPPGTPRPRPQPWPPRSISCPTTDRSRRWPPSTSPRASGSAAAANGRAVVIQLDTPGGLDTSMREIIKAELARRCRSWCTWRRRGAAPRGRRLHHLAAHLAAMAPGTNIGSASPVSTGRRASDTTMSPQGDQRRGGLHRQHRHAARPRPSDWPPVRHRGAQPHGRGGARGGDVVDFIAPDFAALLDSLHGRAVRSTGTRTLDPAAGAVVEDPATGLRQKLLKSLVNPNVAYVLMLLGSTACSSSSAARRRRARRAGRHQPAAGAVRLPGPARRHARACADPARDDPADPGGQGDQLRRSCHRRLTSLVAGVAAALRLARALGAASLGVMVPAVLAFAAFFLVCVWLAVRGAPPPGGHGPAGPGGRRGRVLGTSARWRPGKVFVHGEIWNAVAESGGRRSTAGRGDRGRGPDGARAGPGADPAERGANDGTAVPGRHRLLRPVRRRQLAARPAGVRAGGGVPPRPFRRRPRGPGSDHPGAVHRPDGARSPCASSPWTCRPRT